MRFRRKRLEKQTHIDNFFLYIYIFFYIWQKIRLIFEKKIEKNVCKFFIFEQKFG